MTDLPITKLTAASLNDFLRFIGEGDDIILTKRGGNFTIRLRKAGTRDLKEVPQSFIRSVGFTNTKSSWVVNSPGRAFKSWNGMSSSRGAAASKKVKKENASIKATLLNELGIMELFSDEPLPFEVYTTPGYGKLRRVKLPEHYLYFNEETRIPVGYSELNGSFVAFEK